MDYFIIEVAYYITENRTRVKKKTILLKLETKIIIEKKFT